VTAGPDGARQDTEHDLAAEPDGTAVGETPPAADGGEAPLDGAATGPLDAADAVYDAPTGEGLLDEMKDTIAELTGDLQRLQAEFLNYKRRVDRDREVVLRNAKVNVLSALLPVLDDIDRAREHEELTGGFKAVAEGVERVVAGAGLEKFGAPGDEFDPRLHEALSHSYADQADEVTTTTCQYVVQAGYQIGERVVRPAKVTVVEPAQAGETAGSGGDDAAEA
jgi:molecular chaperone GrpE